MEIFGDAIEHIEKKLDNAIGYVAQNKLINKQTSQEKKKLFAYDVAYRETKNNLEEQSSSMLSSSILSSSDVSAKEKKKIKKAVKNGKEVNIEYFDETSKAYQQAVKYNAALRANQQATQDLVDAQEEYDRWLVEANKMKFDNVVTYYENTIKQFQNNFTDIDNKISEIEASGKRLDKSYYEEQKKINDTILERYQNEHKKLEDRLSTIKEGTQEWYDAKDAIQECENAISECTKTTYKLNNSITQLHYDMFNDIADGIGRIIDEQEFLQGLFAHEKLADDDTGGLTEAGIAKLGSLSASYYASKVKVNNDEKEVEILRNMLNNKLLSYSDGDFSLKFNSPEDLEAKYHEMYDTWQNDITKTYNLEKEVFDVMEQKYQAELAYVNSLIDAKKEALQVEKDLHDYQNSINEKVTDINTLQRQISAYQGDSSEEGMAKLHSLQKQLNDAQKDLQETEYDKYISDQQDMLEKLSTEYEEVITNQLEDFKSIVNKGFEIANNNLSSIDNYLSNVANANGYTEQYKGLFSSVSNAITGNTESGGTLSAIATNVNLATDKIVSAIKDSKVQTPPTTNPNNGSEPENPADNNSGNGVNSSSTATAMKETDFSSVRKEQLAEANKLSLKEAKKYVKKKGDKTPNKDRKEYSAVNKIFYDKKDTYGVLSTKELKELAQIVGADWNDGGAEKKGSLYKRLKAIKFPGFSKGGVVSIDDIEKQVKSNGDTVLGSLNQGERVLTPVQNKLFEQFINNGIPELTATANMLQPMVNVPKLPEIQSRANNIEYGDISFNFELPNVSNSDEFLKAIQSDRKIQKAIQSVSIDRINGGSRLGVKSIR